MEINYIKECFKYHDGDLFWKVRPLHHFKCEKDQKAFNKKLSGNKVGGLTGAKGDKYLATSINNKMTHVHRIVFMLHHGFIPNYIDHIDGNRLNNKIENLRSVTSSENAKNRKANSNNTSGYTGVFWCKKSNKWGAAITSNRKRIYLGLYENKDDAIAKRVEAEKDNGFTSRHGKSMP